MTLRTSTQEAARLMRNEKNASIMAHEARRIIETMPDTHANIGLILDAIEAKCAAQRWADFGNVIDCLNESIAHLEKVYAEHQE